MAHLQGPVPLNDTDYIERSFENELQRELMADRWVLLLGPRQHGKTSALVRLKDKLKEIEMPAALIDLQAAPVLNHYQEFLGWVYEQAQRQINPGGKAASGSGDIGVLLGEILDESEIPAVILIDEASNIRDAQWRNSFYGQLRAVSSRRASAALTDPAARLRFVFAGTFRPETLIDADNSPFNVCERIDTGDMTLEHVKILTDSILGVGNSNISEEIFKVVGGQPFLVQRLLSRVRGREDLRAALDDEISELRTGQLDHIIDLFRKMLSDPALAAIGATMTRNGAVPVEAADPNFRYMQVLGLARRNRSNLVYRNELYAQIASESPQLGGVAASLAIAPMFPVAVEAFGNVQNTELREIAWSAHKGAVAAYRAGANRIALAGFGGSLEAILIDFMTRQPAGSLPGVLAAAGINMGGSQVPNDPTTWKLFNLIKAASKVGPSGLFEPPQALREWRNLIHPTLARIRYKPDNELEPEVRAAATLHELLLRDLP